MYLNKTSRLFRIRIRGMENKSCGSYTDNVTLFDDSSLIVSQQCVHNESACVAWGVPQCIDELSFFVTSDIDYAVECIDTWV